MNKVSKNKLVKKKKQVIKRVCKVKNKEPKVVLNKPIEKPLPKIKEPLLVPPLPVQTPPAVAVAVEKEKKPSINKMYFTSETEKAIVDYNAEQDNDKRNTIYNERIKYAFEKLVENVFNTFKFTYFDTSPSDVQKDVVGFLVSVLHKFDATKGCKAYSYFSVVAKHYLIALNNGNYKRFNQHVDISEEKDENTIQLQSEDKHYKNSENSEFMRLMVKFWENNVNKIFTKPRDLEIANAVIELFRNSDRIEAYNKKALYLYIREISACKTQQITKVINKMKQYQNTVSRSYINEGNVNVNNYIKS